MFELVAPETDQRSCFGKNINGDLREIKSELPAVFWGPCVVEVADDRELPVVVGAELIAMPRVFRTHGVNGPVNLKIF